MLSVFESVKAALIGGAVEIIIQRPSKSRDQECRYHAMIGDIARTVEIDGRYYDTEVWKAKLLEEFDREMKLQGTPLAHPGRIVMSLDGQRYITVRPSSVKFRTRESSDFIEFLFSTGTDLGARWSDPSLRYYQEVSERSAA
jgi:hypothetical protein